MKRLSLQWRITLMTALLICLTCVLINCLVGYSGMRYMDSIGTEMSEHSKGGGGLTQLVRPDEQGARR